MTPRTCSNKIRSQSLTLSWQLSDVVHELVLRYRMSHAFTLALLLSVHATTLFETLSLVYLNRNGCWYNKCSKRTLIKLTKTFPINVSTVLGLRSYHILGGSYLITMCSAGIWRGIYHFRCTLSVPWSILHTLKLICLTNLINLLRPHPTIQFRRVNEIYHVL